MVEGKGMSRAAQKKRKRDHKQKKQFALHSSIVSSRQDFENDDENEDESEELEREVDLSDDGEREGKIMKIDDDILFVRSFPLLPRGLGEKSLQKILELRDVTEITAPQKASLTLQKLLSPLSLETFYDTIWQKTSHLIHDSGRIGNQLGIEKLSSKNKIKKILNENLLRIDEDIRILDTKPSDSSISISDLPESSQEFFRYFLKGKTVNLLQPQKFDDNIWKLFSALEFEFNARVEGNLLLQPQDNIYYDTSYETDRFFVQIEGTSELRYPREAMDLIQFLNEETRDDEEVQNKLVELLKVAGSDIFYLPQGFPLEIKSGASTHSTILIISTNRKNSIADLLEFMVPTAINNLKSQVSFFKASLPADINSYLGIAASESDNKPKRAVFSNLIAKSLESIGKEVLEIIDPAVDQVAKKFIMERLPVPISDEEEILSSYASPNTPISPYTQLRILRPGIAIAVIEDGKCVVYHCMDNSRELFGNPINPLEFDLDDGPAIEALLHAYPHSVTVSDLDHPSDEMDDKISIAQALYKEGILLITDAASQPTNFQSTGSDNEDGIL